MNYTNNDLLFYNKDYGQTTNKQKDVSLNPIQYNALNLLYNDFLFYKQYQPLISRSHPSFIDVLLEAYRLNPILAIKEIANQSPDVINAFKTNFKNINDKTNLYSVIYQHLTLNNTLQNNMHSDSYLDEAKLRYLLYKDKDIIFNDENINLIFDRFLKDFDFDTISGIIYLFKSQDESFLKILDRHFYKPTNFMQLKHNVYLYFFMLFCLQNATQKENLDEYYNLILSNLNNDILWNYINKVHYWNYNDVLKLTNLINKNKNLEQNKKPSIR